MDRPQIVPEPLTRLHRWWLLLTVPDHRRCSFCPRTAGVHETRTDYEDTESGGSVIRVTDTYYCDGCLKAAAGLRAAERDGGGS